MSIFTGDNRAAWVDAFISGIPYARASGMQVTSVEDRRAVLTLPARDTWTGDAERKLIHPGCLSVLADTACGIAVCCSLDEIEPFATLDLRMDYLRPSLANTDLICEAECHRLSRSVAFVRGELRQPGIDEPVATVHATFIRGTANAPRRDIPADAAKAPQASSAAPAPSPSEAASRLVSPESLDPSPRAVSQSDGSPEVPALPANSSPYVDYLGIRQQKQVDAGPVFRLPFQPDLIGNPMLPALHGGVLAGFAETAMVLHLFNNGPSLAEVPRGVDFAIAYMRSAKPVDTFAQCTTVRQGNRVALVLVTLWQDDPQRPVAQARGHFLLS